MSKTFAVAKQPQEFHGHKMPAGAIYGKVTLSYSVKVPTGKTRAIYDKDGYPVFNEDGSLMIRNVLRIEKREETVIFCVEDFQPVSFKDGQYFRAWVKFPRNEYARMHERILCETAALRNLQNYIIRKITEQGLNLPNMWFACKEQKTTHNQARKVAKVAAPRRKVQTANDMPFRGHPCYALNPNVMTEGNMDKASMSKSVMASHKGAFNGRHGEEAGKPYVSPVGKCQAKMRGKDPVFYKAVTTPMGVMRFYNEREYNDYMTAQASVSTKKKNIIIVTR